MNVVWEGAAQQEFVEALTYYGAIDPDLGERFLGATEAAVAEMQSQPLLARKFDGEARKVRMKRFPYAIIYWVDADILHVLAVMHLHREPGYWHQRLI